MKSFFAFFKKELLEYARGGKFLIFGLVFLVLGIMNPVITKLTPWMLDLLAEDLAQSGMQITEVRADALTSWVQFFGNIPIGLIVFVCICCGVFSKEYSSGTLILILTKGLSRCKVFLAKVSIMLIVWTAGYFLCFGVTYGVNTFFFDNSEAVGLLPATLNWWVFGIFVISLMSLLSVVFKSYFAVLLGTGGTTLAIYLLSLIPKLSKYCPTALLNSTGLLVGAEEADTYLAAALISAALSVVFLAASIPIFNKKQL